MLQGNSKQVTWTCNFERWKGGKFGNENGKGFGNELKRIIKKVNVAGSLKYEKVSYWKNNWKYELAKCLKTNLRGGFTKT